MKILRIVTGLVISTILSSKSAAWGVLGHQATALVAEAYLTEDAKQMVRELLGNKRLGDVAMEADNLRDNPEFAHTKNYHFQNIDFYSSDDTSSYRKQVTKDTRSASYKAGAVEAIVKAQEDLANKQSSDMQKKKAIKFLVHFVADLHQPLHTGLKRQKGGNLEYLVWDHESKNLHQVWDSAIIQDSALETNRTGRAQAWNYANRLIQGKHRLAKTFSLGTPEQWFAESLQFQKVAIKDVKRLNQHNYQKWAAEVIEARVYWGGRRLAELINMSVASSASQSGEFAKFKVWLRNQMGDVQRVIRF